MAKLGDYIHYTWKNFEDRGLNKFKGQEINGEAKAEESFRSQIAMAKRGLGSMTNKTILKEIEDQLNQWYGLVENNELKRNFDTGELQSMKTALDQYYANLLKGVTIDDRTLSAAVSSGDYNGKIFNQIKDGKEILTNLQNYAAKGKLSENERTTYDAVSRRVTVLLNLRDAIGASALTQKTEPELYTKLMQLDTAWKQLQAEIGPVEEGRQIQISYNTTPGAKKFVQNLNELIRMFLRSKRQVAGSYAEGVVAAINKFITAESIVTTNDILQALNKNIKNTQKSQSALLNINISNNIDIEKIVEDTSYAKETSKTDFGQVTTSKTEGKVDIIYEFNDLKIPASVKNYNFGNPRFTDIHLLQGSSILQIIQEYQEFSNYYMNISAVHPDGGADPSLTNQAYLAMKMTILLHALQGGVQRLLSSGEVQPDMPASIFIVNDNKEGHFYVFSMQDILSRVSADIERYLKITNFESIENLTNDWIGKENEFSWNQAYARITHLLQQLHNISFEVSISKDVLEI